jgi:hypothetical protein
MRNVEKILKVKFHNKKSGASRKGAVGCYHNDTIWQINNIMMPRIELWKTKVARNLKYSGLLKNIGIDFVDR